MIMMRLRLRRAALRLADHGWSITPGACLRADRFDCGRPGCPTTACHPALESWEAAASRDPARITQWWRYAPHSVLLPTGDAFDVLEIGAPLGALALASPHWSGPRRGPVATTPTGRWMFMVQPGEPLCDRLAGELSVVRHGRGSWVPAPPTRLVGGRVRWTVPPQEVRWRLPTGEQVQRLLLDALTGHQSSWDDRAGTSAMTPLRGR